MSAFPDRSQLAEHMGLPLLVGFAFWRENDGPVSGDCRVEGIRTRLISSVPRAVTGMSSACSGASPPTWTVLPS